MIIELKWHKANDSIAATYKQIDYIENLFADLGIYRKDLPWSSSTNAQRQLTKWDASDIIEALEDGEEVEFE